ncbi:MAG: hypothetical protein QOD67_1679 [Caballeronia sp.]|nr:hypothetical protein [Caballeronia sp.]
MFGRGFLRGCWGRGLVLGLVFFVLVVGVNAGLLLSVLVVCLR